MEYKRLEKSPFYSEKDVFVSHGLGAYENTKAALTSIDLTPARGKKVLLKPNIGRLAEPGLAIVTNPDVIAAAIDVFQEIGAEVVIGESPISGVNTMEAFEVSGCAKIAQERGVALFDMDKNKPIQIAVPEGEAVSHLFACPEIFDADIVVSIPVMKMHMHTGVTIAVKNMKGCLWRRTKVQLHMLPPVPGRPDKPLNIAIADMSDILRPHLSIVDGSVGMEGIGPSAGEQKELGVVVVGIDPFKVDAVSCALMGVDAHDVPHLRIGAERGYGDIDLNNISVFPDNWESYSKTFAKPPQNISMNYPNINILDENSCSSCQSTLLLFLKQYSASLGDYFDEESVNIAIGKGHDAVPENTLCLGNCTKMHQDTGVFVKGCPPVGSEILNVLRTYAGKDEK